MSDDRDVQAYEMRQAGSTFRQVADALGFAAPASARGAAFRGASKVGGEVAPSVARLVEDDTPAPPIDVTRLERGVEMSVPGAGRFRFDRFDDGGQAVTCWGPIGDQYAKWRTFRLARVRTIHRKVKDRATAMAAEAS